MKLRVQKVTPYYDTPCGGPAPSPMTVLVDENDNIVAVRKREVAPYDTHMGGTPDSYDYWEFK